MKKIIYTQLSFKIGVIIFILTNCIYIKAQFTNINISQNPQQSDTRPMVAISHTDQNKAVVVYTGNGVQYSYTVNGGISWSSPNILDITISTSRPQICVDNIGNFYVAAMIDSSRLAIYKSTNGGITFQRISVVPGAYYKYYPSIGFDLTPSSPFANSLYVAWRDVSLDNQYISKSTNNGISWSTPISMGTYGYGPVIGLSPNGQINHIYFGSGLPGAQDVYHFNKSTDGGITFGPDIVVDSGLTLSSYFTLFFPTIACDISGGARNGYIYITFSAGNEANNGQTIDCFFTRSTNNGATWSPHVKITSDTVHNAIHHKPAIAVNQYGNIAINYYDFRNYPHITQYSNTECEAWISRSSNGGITFYDEKISTAMMPYNAADHNNIGMDYWGNKIIPVWTDRRDTNISYEIYTALIDSCTVSGHVTYKDNNQPVNSGLVKALQYEEITHEVVTMDSTIIQPGGIYTFTHFPSHDSVDIMFYQNDDNLDFVPTYYPSTIDWKLAIKVYATQNLTNIDGQVYRINNTTNPYTITGQCTQNITGGLKDAIIYAKIGSDFKNYGISLSDGNYVTTKLPAGNYTLTAYRMGFNEVTQNVAITNTSLTNINFNFGSPIGIQPISNEIPTKFKLYQNYPNPFNPSTTIKFDIPKDDKVKIVIYDIMGREVNTLADENLKAGTYNIKWDASNYASGIYFYRIETNSFAETKKLLLIK